MKFKLDENLEPSLSEILGTEGHEVETVLSERLSGSPDTKIFEVCRSEHRILNTLDLHFANPLRFPAKDSAGIIILRPHRPLLSLIHQLFHSLPAALRERSPAGCLWIVEPGRLRIHG